MTSTRCTSPPADCLLTRRERLCLENNLWDSELILVPTGLHAAGTCKPSHPEQNSITIIVDRNATPMRVPCQQRANGQLQPADLLTRTLMVRRIHRRPVSVGADYSPTGRWGTPHLWRGVCSSATSCYDLDGMGSGQNPAPSPTLRYYCCNSALGLDHKSFAKQHYLMATPQRTSVSAPADRAHHTIVKRETSACLRGQWLSLGKVNLLVFYPQPRYMNTSHSPRC